MSKYISVDMDDLMNCLITKQSGYLFLLLKVFSFNFLYPIYHLNTIFIEFSLTISYLFKPTPSPIPQMIQKSSQYKKHQNRKVSIWFQLFKPSVPICMMMMMMIVNVSSYHGRNKMRSVHKHCLAYKKKKR